MVGEQQQRDPAAIGIFLITGYALFNLAGAVLFRPILPRRSFFGPILVEGPVALGFIGGSALILVGVVIGLLRRRPWARNLGIAYFGVQSCFLLSAVILWVANPERAAADYRAYAGPGNYIVTGHDAVQIMVRPSISTLLIAAASAIYLWKAKRLFYGRRLSEAL